MANYVKHYTNDSIRLTARIKGTSVILTLPFNYGFGLDRIEEAVKGIDRDVQRHERAINQLRTRDED